MGWVVGIAVLVACGTAFHAEAALLSIEPETTYVTANGDVFDVDVHVADISNLMSVNFDVVFNAVALEVLSATDAGFLATGGTPLAFTTIDNVTGNVNYSGVILAGTGPGASGAGDLLTISFRVDDINLLPTDLVFNENTLVILGPEHVAIDVDLTNGVVAVPDIPELGTLAMLACGVLAAALGRRRR